MQPYALASPSVGRPSAATNWRGLSITWEGPDGQKWDLTDRAGGVLLTAQGLEGLHTPRITKYASASRGMPGSRPRGWRTEPRQVFWPLYIWADGSDAWKQRAAAFFDSIHPDRAGTWRVKAGENERSLNLTGVFESTHRYAYDPLLTGWQTYAVELEANQPYWEGEVVARGPWQSPAASPFFSGPPFHISSSSTIGSAYVPNLGDVDSYGTWIVQGPLQEIVLGVGSAQNAVPFDLNAGQTLVIATDPRAPKAVINGVDATRALGLQQWAPVPPGESVRLHVSATGQGSIRFRHTPLFMRAL